MLTPVPVCDTTIPHVFHMGLDGDSQPIDLSDDSGKYTKDTVARLIRNHQIIQAVRQFQRQTGGWNLVLMRKKTEKFRIR